ncbi:hypothetical protein AAKU67_002978, partial [Oxalobacteraceae bacterium GrIS 2.11]
MTSCVLVVWRWRSFNRNRFIDEFGSHWTLEYVG